MAKNKTAVAPEPEETVKDEAMAEATPAVAPEVPAKEKTVTITIPRERSDKEDAVFVSVNERTWLIKKGMKVEVPECVAEVLELREKSLDEAYTFEREKSKK